MTEEQKVAPPTNAQPSDADETASRPGREPGELIVAMSPRQIIGGFALLAGLILMLRRRSRGSRGSRGSSGEG